MATEQRKPPGPTRTSRRRFVRAVSATGALVASGYVKPSLRSLGVPGALAAVSGGSYTGAPPTPRTNTTTNAPLTAPPGQAPSRLAPLPSPTAPPAGPADGMPLPPPTATAPAAQPTPVVAPTKAPAATSTPAPPTPTPKPTAPPATNPPAAPPSTAPKPASTKKP
ncbi:MAG: hypothetical protein ACTHMJ_23895 [Thermomicrobiales bacterium]